MLGSGLGRCWRASWEAECTKQGQALFCFHKANVEISFLPVPVLQYSGGAGAWTGPTRVVNQVEAVREAQIIGADVLGGRNPSTCKKENGVALIEGRSSFHCGQWCKLVQGLVLV
jgi:hypothetical protein